MAAVSLVRNSSRVDPRIFTPTPRGSPTWRRAYARRAALERINARIGRGHARPDAGKHRQNQPWKAQNRLCGACVAQQTPAEAQKPTHPVDAGVKSPSSSPKKRYSAKNSRFRCCIAKHKV